MERRTPTLAERSIVGGEPSGPADDAVVLILTHIAERDTAQGPFYANCTGTLLAPNVVLTARHCVSATSAGTLICDEDGSIVQGTGGRFGADVPPAECHVYVGSTLPDRLDPPAFPGRAALFIHDDANVVCNADVALIVLEEPLVDAKIVPIRLDAPVAKDESVVAVGWGATVTDFVPAERQRRDATVVDVGPSATVRAAGQLGANEFLLSESACFGDSGGPIFDSTTGAVVGTHSRGDQGHTSRNGSGCLGTQHTAMQTGSFKALVLRAFAEAGGAPWREGEPAPDPTESGDTDAVSEATPVTEENAEAGPASGAEMDAGPVAESAEESGAELGAEVGTAAEVGEVAGGAGRAGREGCAGGSATWTAAVIGWLGLQRRRSGLRRCQRPWHCAADVRALAPGGGRPRGRATP